MASSELMGYISQWRTLLWSDIRETSYELAACDWNDVVGARIKEKIEETVYAYLQEGLSLYANDVLNIDMTNLEDVLSKAEWHLAHPNSTV